MANEKNNPDTTGRELQVTRLLSAPRELVWDVFTQPDHIARWWGPDGFTTTIQKMEMVAGGEWNLVMHGPDGRDYKNKSIFTEITRPERIVYEHLSAPKFTATIQFTEEQGRTRLDWRMLFATPADLEEVVKVFKADIGLKQNAEKLEKYLVEQPIVVERVLDVPVEKLWSAITDKSEMKNWYFDLAEFRAEPGFKFEFTGGPQDGIQYVHLCEIQEVILNKKLSYSWRYKGYPGNSLVSFILTPQGNKTLLTLTHSGLETFPQDIPDFGKHNFMAGWNEIINSSLASYFQLVH